MVSLASLAAGLALPAQTTLVSDTFTRTGNLNGSTPDVTVGGAAWVAKTTSGVATTGGSTLSLPGSNQTDTLDLGSNVFATNPGVYTLTATITLPAGSTTPTNFGLGFVTNPVTTTSLGTTNTSAGLNPAGGSNGGSPWMYITQTGSVYVNRDGINSLYSSTAGTYPSGSSYTLSLVLDTTAAQWKVNAYVNSTQLDLNGGSAGLTYTYTTNPSGVRFIGITSVTSTVTATLDNFSLTGPAIATTPPALPQFTQNLIHDDFASAGVLNTKVPPVSPNAAAWAAKTGTTVPTNTGGILSFPANNSTAALDMGNGFVASHPGLYVLSATITIPVTAPVGTFYGLGFSENPKTTSPLLLNTSVAGVNPNGGKNGGTPWMYLNANTTVALLNELNAFRTETGSFANGTPHSLKMILDTTQAKWVVSAYVDGVQLDLDVTQPELTWTYPSNPTGIRYAALTAGSGTGSPAATIDEFRLDYFPDDVFARLGDFNAPGNTPAARPYNDVWVEGEAYTSQTGGVATSDAAAYAGSKWVGDGSGDSATYTVNLPAAGTYLVNLAGSKIGGAGSAPLAYSLDGGPAVPLAGGAATGGSWSSGNLLWNTAAIISVQSGGSHTLSFSLTGAGSFTIDALAFVSNPAGNVLFTQSNFAQSQIWGSTVSASTSNAGFPAANVMGGNPNIGWKPTVATPSTSTLTITFTGERSLETIRLVKGVNASSGSSMPTAYTVELLEGGTWVTRVEESANTSQQAVYPFPAAVKATAVRLTVTGTLGNNIPYVNQFEAYGSFMPQIVAPVHGAEVKAASSNVYGFTQPNAPVTIFLNGAAGPSVTADANGWFAANVTLASGENVIQAQAATAGVKSSWHSNALDYNAANPSSLSLSNRRGFGIMGDEGANYAVVNSAGQSSAVPYTIRNETGATVSSGSVDLSKSGALIPLPASTGGWYDITVSGSPALTQSLSVLPRQFVLPNRSGTGINTVTAGTVGQVSVEDQAIHFPVITDYVGTLQAGWVRDSFVWGTGTNPSEGVYDWAATDAKINTFLARGQKVLIQVLTFPGYMNSQPTNPYLYQPEDLRKTYAFGREVGTHFAGRVSALEFQNEYDWNGNAKQSVNSLMAHQRAFYLGVKSTAPGIMVGTTPVAYVRSTLTPVKNLRGEALDIFTFHWYPQGTGGAQVTNLEATGQDQLPDSMAYVNSILEGRAAWNTECGYYSTVPGTASNESQYTAADELTQADFYGKMSALQLANGLNNSFGFAFPYYWEYVIHDVPNGIFTYKHFGMLRKTGFSPLPSVNAVSVLNQHLSRATYYGRLNTGNANITGLVFKNSDNTYVLQLWANNPAGVTNYTLPGGISKTQAMDYMGRITDVSSGSQIAVQTTAKFLKLSGTSVTAVTTPSPYAAPSTAGVAPSPVVMRWNILKPVRSISFKDAYDMTVNSSTSSDLEVVNLGTTTFNGTIAVTTSNSRWTLTPGGSLTVSLAPGGRTVIPFNLTAGPNSKDDLRIEARVDDGTGKFSVAVDTLQTTGTTSVIAPVAADGAGNITLPAHTPRQNYLGFDGLLKWTSGVEGSVNYMEAFRSTGSVALTAAQWFKAPALEFQANLTGNTTYHVWVKAKAATTGTNQVYIGTRKDADMAFTSTTVTGFTSSGWTWSKASISGPATLVTDSSSLTRYVQVWPSNNGLKISQVIFTKDFSFVPESSFVETIVDNSDTASVTVTGTWNTSTSTAGYHGANYQHDVASGKGSKSFRYTPNLATAGNYEIFVRYTGGTDRANNAPYDVVHTGGTATVPVDQRVNGANWISLGTYNFNAGTGGYVLLRNGGTTGYVIADAVKFRKL